MAYRVSLEVFEGPLDLLLRLVEQQKLDITAVSLVKVVDQYLDYLRRLSEVDLEATGEFLFLAARLLALKAKVLLPVREQGEAGQEEVDEGEALVRHLEEYRRFKMAAGLLLERQEKLASYPPSLDQEALLASLPLPDPLAGLTLKELAAVARLVFNHSQTDGKGPAAGDGAPERVVPRRRDLTVAAAMRGVLNTVQRQPGLTFGEVLKSERLSPGVAVVYLLAVLELVRREQLRTEQGGFAAPIALWPGRGGREERVQAG